MNLQANRVAEAWASEENQAVRKAFVLAPYFKIKARKWLRRFLMNQYSASAG